MPRFKLVIDLNLPIFNVGEPSPTTQWPVRVSMIRSAMQDQKRAPIFRPIGWPRDTMASEIRKYFGDAMYEMFLSRSIACIHYSCIKDNDVHHGKRISSSNNFKVALAKQNVQIGHSHNPRSFCDPFPTRTFNEPKFVRGTFHNIVLYRFGIFDLLDSTQSLSFG
eukprot:scaffold950_cov360-Pavlova_lutheri.AAC.37